VGLGVGRVGAEADERQGRAAAEKWKKDILSGHYKTWSDEQLASFNRTLTMQRDNPAFTATLFTGLGAEGTLSFWRELAHPYDGPGEGERAKLLAKVQDNLGMSLANLSYEDSPAVDQWKKDLIAAGPKQLPGDLLNGPTGFQVMSSLMGKGRFEDKFLNDYGSALVKHDAGHALLDPPAVSQRLHEHQPAPTGLVLTGGTDLGPARACVAHLKP
jgi:hypothetical protein